MPSEKPQLCAWCKKPLFGEVSYPKDKPGWCHDCSTTYGDVAVFQCNNCGRAIGGIKPGKTDIGYVVRPNQVLHVDKCPECTPDLVKSTCIEFDAYLKGKCGSNA